MGGFENVPGEMDILTQTLETGAAGLDGIGPAPVANAGESIGVLADAVARLARASAGVSGGLHHAAEDVRAAKSEYLRADDTGADNMPR
ncbi:hypothetical protein [Saccharopolyspora taberi]|uniref:ESX-1 secretion-associated protein n=1 Tax=Saccharopolyspora taberi TaxID=60895 RepID=A0ABN3V9G3_9PSEU